MSEIKGVYFTLGSFPGYGWYDPNKEKHWMCGLFWWRFRPEGLWPYMYMEAIGLSLKAKRVGFKVDTKMFDGAYEVIIWPALDQTDFPYEYDVTITRADGDIDNTVLVDRGPTKNRRYGNLAALLMSLDIGEYTWDNGYRFYALATEVSFLPGQLPKKGELLWQHLARV